MVSIAAKNLFHDRTRLGMSAGGVGFAIMLVLILAGTYDGFYRQAGLFTENSGADLFVGQAGVVDTLHSFSILPLNLSDQLATIPGVQQSSAIISRTVELHVGNADHPREIVVDQIMARKYGLSLGSAVRIGEREFTVVGVSAETNMFIMQYAFVRFEDITGLVLPPGTTTYFLVKVTPGSDLRTVQAALDDRLVGVEAFTLDEITANNRNVIAGLFLPILLTLYLIGFVVGITVIGLTVYTATMERAREYGVLKAIGTSNRRLARIVLVQALLLAMIGFVAGLAFTASASIVIGLTVPEMTLFFTSAQVMEVFVAALGMSVVATALPLGRLARIDPASIFRRG